MGPEIAMSVAIAICKSLDFQGPTLTMALVMDIACLKIITSRAIKTTDQLIVTLELPGCFMDFVIWEFPFFRGGGRIVQYMIMYEWDVPEGHSGQLRVHLCFLCTHSTAPT